MPNCGLKDALALIGKHEATRGMLEEYVEEQAIAADVIVQKNLAQCESENAEIVERMSRLKADNLALQDANELLLQRDAENARMRSEQREVRPVQLGARSRAKPQPKKLDTECRNWLKGKCPWGEKCKFKHVPKGYLILCYCGGRYDPNEEDAWKHSNCPHEYGA